jgi:AAA15 family ATPase/GTPase
MIESIEIKNFRCFKDTKIAKFGLVNLFGGLNNAGKTTLLEALYLIKNPHVDVIVNSRNTLRNESESFAKEKPENAWDTFFYQTDMSQSIEININDTKTGNRKLSLKCDERIDDFIDYAQESKRDVSSYINQISGSKKSALHIDIEDNGVKTFPSVLIASNTGFHGSSKAIESTAFFLLSSMQFEYSELAKDYDKAKYDGNGEHFLKALRIIDKSIEKIEVFAIGEPVIYLTKNNGTRLPLSLFGDAISKVIAFVLTIVNHPNSVVLIDEIENGIHYTKQAKLWEMLFKLAIEFNIQIFSTSHSLEMIKAFAKVASMPEFAEKAAYFEMARHYKTGNIIGTSIPMDDLKYYIESNSPFRGD